MPTHTHVHTFVHAHSHISSHMTTTHMLIHVSITHMLVPIHTCLYTHFCMSLTCMFTHTLVQTHSHTICTCCVSPHTSTHTCAHIHAHAHPHTHAHTCGDIHRQVNHIFLEKGQNPIKTKVGVTDSDNGCLKHSAKCFRRRAGQSETAHCVALAPTFSSQRKRDPEDLPRESGRGLRPTRALPGLGLH